MRVIPVVASLILLLATAVAAQRPDTSVRGVIAAADAYLSNYQQQLTFLLADEHSLQRVFDPSGAQTAERPMAGELFVTFVPADRAWMSVHDVAQVDGERLADREDLRRLLERQPVAGAARELSARNARFNIGSILRNFNEPTLALLVLEPRRRSQFRFDRERVERAGGVDVVTVRFRETERPTLVRGVDGSELYSTGELAIEAGTGRIHRTFIRFTYGPVVAELTTVYAPDPNLDLWVPSTFTERYERTRDLPEVIVCEATYTNWRRWGVDVRIR